jgi:hypothetical protein
MYLRHFDIGGKINACPISGNSTCEEFCRR